MKDENPFKEKLYHHTMPVSDELWNRIELQLPVVKKRFPFFWFTIASVVLIAGTILLSTQLSDPAKQELPAPQKNTVPASPTIPEETAQEVSLNENSELQTSSNPEINSSSSSAQNKAESNFRNPTYKSSPVIKHDLESSEIPVANNSNIYSTHNPYLSTNISTNKTVNFFNPTASLPFNGIDFIPSGDALAGIKAIRPDPSCYKFTGQETQSNLSVDLFAGPGFAPRTFKNTSAESILYSEARLATEQGRYAWSGGVRMNLKLNHELAVRVGIMYEQIGDVFDYTDTLATQQSTIIDTFWSANGTFLYTETRTILILGTLIKKIHNRYHHLDIPLLASYELPLGRSTLMINAGPVINLTSSSRGQILDPLLIPRNITIGEPNYLKAYKNNLGLSVYLGAGALIPFNKYFSGLIEPRFMYRIKPVTIDSYPIKENRHFAGINLGIRYHFD